MARDNKNIDKCNDENVKDDRLITMLNYIQTNYQTVTLEDMANEFHLSTPYISKYIKDKSGKTFGEHVTQIRLKRAKTLLKNGNMTVENISYAIGYPNAEHFIRVFKKTFNMTPIQYRNMNWTVYWLVSNEMAWYIPIPTKVLK